MVLLHVGEQSLEVKDNETVLECLERHEISHPSSCRNGHCKVCMMTCTQGETPEKAKEGLALAQRKVGAFLPCICRPREDLTLKSLEVKPIRAQLVEHEMLNDEVARLRFSRPDSFEVLPGQFVHVHKDDKTLRSYSVANRPMVDNAIELHVRAIPKGQVSPWLVQELSVGEEVQLSGPHGACIYTDDAPDKPLILAGTSTGLAPLLGILKEALAQGHRAPIELYHGARTPDGFYLVETLRKIQQENPQVSVFWSALENADAHPEISSESIEKMIQSRHPKTKEIRSYLCGAPDFVKTLKRNIFLAGAPMKEILSDPFAA